VLACAENEEVWKVTEEEKCVYRMEVGTPAVCENPAAVKSAGSGAGQERSEL
jgi:protein kinase C substrate 80K-H